MKQTLVQSLSPAIAIALLAILLAGFNKDKLTPEEARALAQEVYVFGLPAVYNSLQAEVLTNAPKPEGPRAPAGQFAHYRQCAEAAMKEMAGFNLDALYSTSVLDLSRDAYVLSIPPMGDRYWIVRLIDAWNELAAAPSARTVGGKGGTFLIAGPNWAGDAPDGMTVLHSSTELLMVAPRIYTWGRDDYENVHQLQDRIKLTPLVKWGSDWEPPVVVPVHLGVDGKTPVGKQVFAMAPETYFTRLCRLLVHDPPHELDRDVITHMAALGMTPGGSFRMDRFGPAVQKAIRQGVSDGQREIEQGRARLVEMRNGWQVMQDLGRYGTRYSQRAAATYYVVGGNLVGDAFYASGLMDDEGKRLNGGHKYTLRFPEGRMPPAGAIWSVTLFDPEANGAGTPIHRTSLGSRDRLERGADGSVTLYIQHEPPGAERENNWLPAPAGAFELGLRLYGPGQDVADSAWEPPPVVRLKQ
jgi:hypothetical protein